MFTTEQTNLKSIFNSNGGLHLTVYIKNRGQVEEIKRQLHAAIEETYAALYYELPEEQRKQFLAPLEELAGNITTFKSIDGNIGIFRSLSIFKIFSIPVEVQESCHIASSFHIKPLLRWVQDFQQFHFLLLEKESAHLYLGSQRSFELFDSIFFPEFIKPRTAEGEFVSMRLAAQTKKSRDQTVSLLSDWILELTRDSQIRFFYAGERSLSRALGGILNYKKAVRCPLPHSFRGNNLIESWQSILETLKRESKKYLEDVLSEFIVAEKENRTQKDIHQISKAVIRGEVEKLIITDDLSIFGRVDRKSGSLEVNPYDQDNEDDCIMDDLAQIVLNQGGEVVIAKRDQIPQRRPILALVRQKLDTSNEETQYQILEERFG